MDKTKHPPKRRLNHRFRFQLLHQWLTEKYLPCKVADVGGGKGLLAYLLSQSGWDVTVIDPLDLPLPPRFKDLNKNRTKLKPEERVFSKKMLEPFEEEMAKDFDLLIGMHAHGSNMKIINACKKYGKDFLLLPCCVIDEPIVKRPGVNWINSLIEYAKKQGFEVKTERLNFVGQSLIVYSDTNLKRLLLTLSFPT